MKAFYLIHAAIIVEIVLTILGVLKLQEYIFRLKKLSEKISKNTNKKAQEIQFWREKIQSFNKSCTQKMDFVHNFGLVRKLLFDLSLQGLLKKFFFPKNSFFAKILNYKTTIFWFLASFWFFNKKNA